MEYPDPVDFRPLKQAVLRLPSRHPVRLGVLQEQDLVPRAAALGKLETYLIILFEVKPDHGFDARVSPYEEPYGRPGHSD